MVRMARHYGHIAHPVLRSAVESVPASTPEPKSSKPQEQKCQEPPRQIYLDGRELPKIRTLRGWGIR
jgi:hypothetical protein